MNKFYSILCFLIISHIGLSKSYTIDQININAEILADGNIQITEARTYTFDGEFSWADYQLPLDKMSEVKLFGLREGSQNYYESHDELPGSYFAESTKNKFYTRWHFRAKNQSRTFILRYLVTDVVTVYNDIAELYYKFIGETNEMEIGQVDVTIKLPEYANKDSVQIWAHGPLYGLIKFNEGKIDLSVSPLPAKNFFEARVIFPPAWVPFALNKKNIFNREKILAEEKLWAEEANQARENAQEALRIRKENEQKAFPLAIALSLIGFILVMMLYKKYGKGFETPYHLKIDSQIPRNIHPTILCCLYNNKNVYGSALSTTIFDLANRNILAIEQVEVKNRNWWKAKTQLVFKLNRSGWLEIRSQMKNFENDLLRFFFDELGEGKDQIELQLFKKSATQMRKWFEKWKKILKDYFKHIKLYEKKSIRATVFSIIFSSIIILAGLLILIILGFPGVIALISGVFCLALSFSILRYTEEMKLKRKKWQALRNYIKKYHFVNETDSGWQNQAGEYFVYGLALGVGNKALEKMVSVISPDKHAAVFPWYIYAHGNTQSSAAFAKAITSVVSITSTTVSSSAGAGGGASGGGGGGAGGASGGAG